MAALLVGAVYLLALQSLPDYEGRHVAEGLGAPVRIVRDAHAVPHIHGESDSDVLFGLGYAHAQDRLWQMLSNRAIIQGRIAERVGEPGLEFDRRMRVLGLHEAARRSLEHLPQDAAADLEAYAAGVNARLAQLASEPRGRGAPELFLFGNVPVEPWTPADSLSIIKLMAFNLSGAAWEEIGRARLLRMLPRERVRDLTSLGSEVELAEPPAERAGTSTSRSSGFPGGQRAGASNAWAVDGSRSSHNRPILATDPHLSFTAPVIWYLAQLNLPSAGVIAGATIPGLPAIVIGRNNQLGWCLTHAYVDDQDIYLEQPNPDDPNLYRTPEGWRRFEAREERIRVRFRDEDEVLVRRTTRHGPVLPPEIFGLENLSREGLLHSLRWTALDPDDRSYQTARQLMRAGSVEEALKALEGYVAPMQVVTLADANGIAQQVAGRAPLRHVDSPGRGQVPGRGWDARDDWQGYLPRGELPGVMRPPSGFVAHANNRITNAPYPRHLATSWPARYRYQRLENLLGERGIHSPQYFRDMQNDTFSLMAQTVLPLMNAALSIEKASDAVNPRLRERAREELWSWTGDMDAGLAAPLIFYGWLEDLARELVERRLGETADVEQVVDDSAAFVERVLGSEESAAWWCDRKTTAAVEDCGSAVTAAFDRALASLEAAYGQDVAAWRWGRAHRALHRHVPLGFIEPLGGLFNISHEISGGSHTLLRAVHRSNGAAFNAVHGAGLRGIYSFARADQSNFATSTGQSGHFLSPHYNDLGRLWRKGAYHRISLDPEDAMLGSVGTLILSPPDSPASR